MKDKAICKDTGMLLIRLSLAIVFIAYGWAKVGDMAGTVGFFSSLGLSSFWAYLVGWVELLGGIAMLLGVCTKWAGWLLAITMAVAIYLVKGSAGLMGGYDFNLVLLLTALGVSFTGPGTLTIGKLLGKE